MRNKYFWQSLVPGGGNTSVRVVDGDVNKAIRTWKNAFKNNGTLDELITRQQFRTNAEKKAKSKKGRF